MREEASVDDRLAGSVPFTAMSAVAVAGWQLTRQARAVANGASPALALTKPVTTRYFLDHIVPEAVGLASSARAGAGLLYELPAEALSA
jgi:3-(methylthio)propanoyl-CoA dehydrogenase